jgi:hypothetical protein
MQNKSRDHIPVSVHLKNKAAMLPTPIHNPHKLIGRRRQKLPADIAPRLPHHGLAPKFVLLKDQFSLLDGNDSMQLFSSFS